MSAPLAARSQLPCPAPVRPASYTLLVPVGGALVLAAKVEAGKRVAGDDDALALFADAAQSVSAPLTQKTTAE